MNAPVISLLGFADVNRQLFRGVSRKINRDGTGLSIDPVQTSGCITDWSVQRGKDEKFNSTDHNSAWGAKNLLASQEMLLNL
jgi:hypothetical protein